MENANRMVTDRYSKKMGTDYNIDSLTRAELVAGLQAKANNDTDYIVPSNKAGYTHIVDIAIDSRKVTSFNTNAKLRTHLRNNANINIVAGRDSSVYLRDQIISGLQASLAGKILDIEDGLFFELVDV